MERTNLLINKNCKIQSSHITSQKLTSSKIRFSSLSIGKAADGDEIRLEMLKALNGKNIFWLARVFQVACVIERSGKTATDRQTKVVIPIQTKKWQKKTNQQFLITFHTILGNLHVYAK